VTPPPGGRIRDMAPRPWHQEMQPQADKRATPEPRYPLGWRMKE
jgi:hypothetical protein